MKPYKQAVFMIYKDGRKFSWYTEKMEARNGEEHSLECIYEFAIPIDAVRSAVEAGMALCDKYQIVLDSETDSFKTI